MVLLLIAYYTRHHFNRDRVKYNPYKMIFKVLNFARKNKYPVGPVSAFTHCYDFRPSRLDYAKERYGGPFTTSDVEDVKTFKNVFILLISSGPFFVLEVPTSNSFYPMLYQPMLEMAYLLARVKSVRKNLMLGISQCFPQ